MAKSRQNQEGKEPAAFKPRRAVLPIGEPDEKRVVVRAYMPASLAKDITLYAIERDCSVSDLLNSVLRKAIPSLKVVATPLRRSCVDQLGEPDSVTLDQSGDGIDGDDEPGESSRSKAAA